MRRKQRASKPEKTIVVGTTWVMLMGVAAVPMVSSAQVPGTWELVSVEGGLPNTVVVTRIDAVEFDMVAVDLNAGDWVREARILGITLELHPEGDFREDRTQVQTDVIAPQFLQRLERFSWWPDDEVLRMEGDPDTTVVFGRWSMENDTVYLRQDRSSIVRALYEMARRMAEMQGASTQDLAEIDPDLRAWAETEFEQRVGDAPIRFRGVVEGDRLEVWDPNGVQMMFRREAVPELGSDDRVGCCVPFHGSEVTAWR